MEVFFMPIKRALQLQELNEFLANTEYNSFSGGVDKRGAPLWRVKLGERKIGIIVASHEGLIYQIESLLQDNKKA